MVDRPVLDATGHPVKQPGFDVVTSMLFPLYFSVVPAVIVAHPNMAIAGVVEEAMAVSLAALARVGFHIKDSSKKEGDK
jgi:hypothetical protein